MTPNRFLHPLPLRPAADGASGRDVVMREQINWEPINPAVGNAFVGTSLQTGERILAAHDNTAPPLPPMYVQNGMTTDGRPTIATTPATRPFGLPTPMGTPAVHLVSPPVIPTTTIPPFTPNAQIPPPMPPVAPPVGNHALFPQHLPAGTRTMGVPDPTLPGAFWVEHTAPGPHTGVSAIPSLPGAATTPGAAPQFSWTPGPPAPPPMVGNFTPGFTPGSVPAFGPAMAPSPWPVQSCPTTPAWVMRATPSVMLNPHLCVNLASVSQPPLVWDIAHLPSRATLRHLTGRNLIIPVKGKEFKEAAVYPPGLAMHIHLNHHAWSYMYNAWGPIIVNYRGKDNKVSVWDVLDAVYNYLQNKMDWEEYCAVSPFGTSDENHNRLMDAWDQRCLTADSLEDFERSQGVRRIDILGDDRRWCGKCQFF